MNARKFTSLEPRVINWSFSNKLFLKIKSLKKKKKKKNLQNLCFEEIQSKHHNNPKNFSY